MLSGARESAPANILLTQRSIFLDLGLSTEVPFSLPPYLHYYILRLEDVRVVCVHLAGTILEHVESERFDYTPPVFANPDTKAGGHDH